MEHYALDRTRIKIEWEGVDKSFQRAYPTLVDGFNLTVYMWSLAHETNIL